MWISPSFKREYCDWIAAGQFTRLLARESRELETSIPAQHPAIIARSLATIATCYYTRGMVSLLNRDESGWHDVQAGYWSSLYSLRFEIKACTLPAWSRGRTFHWHNELIATRALARLFGQTGEQQWVETAISEHFDFEKCSPVGKPGYKLLVAMRDEEIRFSYEELSQDRRACCKTRDAFPVNPTEVRPIGILDIENILHYPSDAAFRYGLQSFAPTEDAQITNCIVAYHSIYI